jgi:hypothetical protein
METAKEKNFNEIVKSVLKKYGIVSSQKYIYHYTNASGLEGILKTKQLWFTERNYMNDIYDEKNVKKYIKENFGKAINFKGSVLEETLIPNITQYVFSTTPEKDVIHQWAYYGKGDSYCIELERKKLIDYLYDIKDENEAFYYGPVLYDDKIKIQIINDVANDYKNSVLKSLDSPIFDARNSEHIKIAKNVYRYFYSLIKQYGHYCEKEYRFLFETTKEPEFRTKDGLFIPYQIIENRSMKLPINKIIIGPSNHEEVAKDGLRLFLKKYYWENVKIEKSKLSVRD